MTLNEEIEDAEYDVASYTEQRRIHLLHARQRMSQADSCVNPELRKRLLLASAQSSTQAEAALTNLREAESRLRDLLIDAAGDEEERRLSRGLWPVDPEGE